MRETLRAMVMRSLRNLLDIILSGSMTGPFFLPYIQPRVRGLSALCYPRLSNTGAYYYQAFDLILYLGVAWQGTIQSHSAAWAFKISL